MTSIVFFLAGAIFLIIGIYIQSGNNKVKREGKKAKAQVIDHQISRSTDADNRSKTLYYPVLKFTNSKGKEITETAFYGTSWKVKEEYVPIIYLKKNGRYKILLEGKISNSILPIIFIVLGSIFAFTGLMGIVMNFLFFGF